MKREVLAVVCAMAAAAFLSGCAGGAAGAEKSGDTKNGVAPESGTESTDEDGVADQSDAQGGVADQSDVQDSAEADGGKNQGESAQAGTVQLAGTTFSILGDSISTFQGFNPIGYYAFFPDNGEVADVQETWWQKVATIWNLLSMRTVPAPVRPWPGIPRGRRIPNAAAMNFAQTIFPARRGLVLTELSYFWEPTTC